MFQFRDRFSLKLLMVIIFLLGSSFSRNIEPLQKHNIILTHSPLRFPHLNTPGTVKFRKTFLQVSLTIFIFLCTVQWSVWFPDLEICTLSLIKYPTKRNQTGKKIFVFLFWVSRMSNSRVYSFQIWQTSSVEGWNFYAHLCALQQLQWLCISRVQNICTGEKYQASKCTSISYSWTVTNNRYSIYNYNKSFPEP